MLFPLHVVHKLFYGKYFFNKYVFDLCKYY